MVHSLNIIHRCLNPLEPFIYICKKAQCMILYIGEELPITTYSYHRCLRSGELSYDQNRLCDWEASATFGFHGKVWVFAQSWATEISKVGSTWSLSIIVHTRLSSPKKLILTLKGSYQHHSQIPHLHSWILNCNELIRQAPQLNIRLQWAHPTTSVAEC